MHKDHDAHIKLQFSTQIETPPQTSPNPPRVVTAPPRSTHHKHTIIWLHGLHETPEKYLHMFEDPLFDNFKIIAPEAPKRYVTVLGERATSWFDVKFRSQKSFVVDFDQAFSKSEVLDSYQRIIKPLIYGAKEELNHVNPNGKLIIAGFSQGCGMSLHAFFSQKQKIDAVIGLSGYLFPFTPFQQTTRYHCILYGKNDSLRPWQYVQTTYLNKIDIHKVFLIENTSHQINEQVIKQFHNKILEFFGL